LLKTLSPLAIIYGVKRKQKKILAAIFAAPTSDGIKFSDIEGLLVSLDATEIQGRRARAAFVMPNDLKWEARGPHPGKEAKKYQIESVRLFLQKLGITGNE
jgi:hypothetical protein